MHDPETLPTEGRPDPDLLPGAGSLVGISGNAGAIMGFVAEALKRAGASRDYIMQYRLLAMSGDYDELLALSMEVLGG